MSSELDLLKKELALLRYEEKDRYLNPHKYYDLYPWQDEFIYQEDHIKRHGRFPHRLYLTAANQCGKTVTLMLFALRLCTDIEFRKRQWGNNQPRVGWYVLPTQEHINEFYEDKWEAEILSKDEAKAKGPYSWKVIKKGRDIKGIHFLATNVKLMFITMASRGSSMQGRSIGFIIFDEEPEVSKLGELETRTNAFNDPETGLSNAIIAFAFTPTTAQEYFKKIFCYQDLTFLEKIPEDVRKEYFWDKQREEFRTCTPQQEKEELFKIGPTVYKRRVSLFETQRFKSGKPGRYKETRIKEIIKDSVSKKDLMMRVFASFEREDQGGLIYKYFDRSKHMKWLKNFPKDLLKIDGLRTAGLDYGSGSNHPGGCSIVWISPDFKKARVIKMWRGEKGKVTSAQDIVEKFIEMSAGMNIDFPFYDHSCRDLKTIYNRITGKELLPAVKDKEGYGVVDTLLQHNILQLWGYSNEPYLDWAAQEFENINHATAKKDRLDELTDTIRYALAGVAHLFNLEDLAHMPVIELEKDEDDIFKTKVPEDFDCRSWDQVKELNKRDQDSWTDNEMSFWEGEFNGM